MLLKIAVAAVLFGSACAAAQVPDKANSTLRGTVRDSSGAVIPGAQITVRTTGTDGSAETDRDGRFSVPVLQQSGTISVSAAGFAPYQGRWSSLQSLEIILAPASRLDQVVVTPARTPERLEDVPEAVTVITASEIENSGAMSIDLTLKQVPGFTLFRRTSSRFANPTSQGASMRGVGASGASRTLVLQDGIPLNDPFGGWIYWNRIPRLSVQSIEVVPGGQSTLYGSSALGGVVNILSRSPESDSAIFELSGGNHATPDGSAWAGHTFGSWYASAAAEASQTDGYIAVEPAQRGAVDTPVNSRFATVNSSFGRKLSRNGEWFARLAGFADERHNGTPLQTNNTQIGTGVMGYRRDLGPGVISTSIDGGLQHYTQSFSAIALDRNGETLTRTQQVPASQVGGSVQWGGTAGKRHFLVAGSDVRNVIGESDEIGYSAGLPTLAANAGGKQIATGIFVSDMITLHPKLVLTAGVRADFWSNFDAFNQSHPLSMPASSRVSLPGRSDQFASPRVSLLYRLASGWSVAASGYRSFRAPTLNELYRSFRVGNVLTLANSQLRAERLTGAEGGLRFSRASSMVRITYFWAQIDDPVANRTLSITPALIMRQRQNLGRTQSQGVELSFEQGLGRWINTGVAYEFASATVTSFPADPGLQGLFLPQVPKHQFTAHIESSEWKKWTVGAQLRATGQQFDDDRNQLPLAAYATLDVFVARNITRQLEIFAAGENVTDSQYATGRTPVVTLGPPAYIRGGVRVRLGGR